MTINAQGNCARCGRHLTGQLCPNCDTHTMTMPEDVYRRLTGIDILVEDGCCHCVLRHGSECGGGREGHIYANWTSAPDTCPLRRGPIKIGLVES